MIIIGDYCGIINSSIWNKNMVQKSTEIQEQIQEKPLEAPFFWAFVIWLIPPAGILLGLTLLNTKDLPQNRKYGYKAIITGIIGSIAPIFVYAAMSSYFKSTPQDRNFGVISQMIAVYLMVYGALVGSLCGGISGSSESRVRTSGKHLKKYKNKKIVRDEQLIDRDNKEVSYKCKQCGFKNEEGSRFCEQCGVQLEE